MAATLLGMLRPADSDSGPDSEPEEDLESVWRLCTPLGRSPLGSVLVAMAAMLLGMLAADSDSGPDSEPEEELESVWRLCTPLGPSAVAARHKARP